MTGCMTLFPKSENKRGNNETPPPNCGLLHRADWLSLFAFANLTKRLCHRGAG